MLVRLGDSNPAVTLDIDYTAPYSISWDVSGEVRLGQHRLYAEAVDAVGNRTSMALAHAVTITIDPDGISPFRDRILLGDHERSVEK